MLIYMLDTNICIYLIKGRQPELGRKFDSKTASACISTVVLAELRFGVERSERREQNAEALEIFVANLQVLSFDSAAAAHYGQLRAELARVGMPCGLHDTQIGAHARSRGLVVVTNNRREFDRMPGVRVENWV